MAAVEEIPPVAGTVLRILYTLFHFHSQIIQSVSEHRKSTIQVGDLGVREG